MFYFISLSSYIHLKLVSVENGAFANGSLHFPLEIIYSLSAIVIFLLVLKNFKEIDAVSIHEFNNSWNFDQQNSSCRKAFKARQWK